MGICNYIENTPIEEIVLPNLFDAHRHGLFIIDKKFSLKGVPVDQWIYNKNFINYEKKLDAMTEEETKNYLLRWIKYSLNEGVGTIFDISGKKYNKTINKFYKSFNINQLLAQYWSLWDKNQKNVKLLIIPDESKLCEDVIETVKLYLQETDGVVMMHALESKERKDVFIKKYNQTTIQWLEKNKLLNNRMYLVHMNVASKEDFEIVKHYNSHVVLCPSMRDVLSNPEPDIIDGINLHFGTDGPIATGEYSLWRQAILQYNIWKSEGMCSYKASKLAVKALFSSPYENDKIQIGFTSNENKIEPKNKFIEILKSYDKNSNFNYKVLKK